MLLFLEQELRNIKNWRPRFQIKHRLRERGERNKREKELNSSIIGHSVTGQDDDQDSTAKETSSRRHGDRSYRQPSAGGRLRTNSRYLRGSSLRHPSAARLLLLSPDALHLPVSPIGFCISLLFFSFIDRSID